MGLGAGCVAGRHLQDGPSQHVAPAPSAAPPAPPLLPHSAHPHPPHPSPQERERAAAEAEAQDLKLALFSSSLDEAEQQHARAGSVRAAGRDFRAAGEAFKAARGLYERAAAVTSPPPPLS